MKYRVFVYGTLLKGHGNHRLMRSATFLFQGTTMEDFVMYGAGFPLARPATPIDNPAHVGKVSGEVYEVDKDTLGELDRLEGHPTFYCRTRTKISPFLTQEIWMYHWVQGNRVVGETHRPDDDGVLYWPRSVQRLVRRTG